MSRLVNILSGISTNYISKRERIRFGFIPTPIIYNNKKVKKSLNNKKKIKKKDMDQSINTNTVTYMDYAPYNDTSIHSLLYNHSTTNKSENIIKIKESNIKIRCFNNNDFDKIIHFQDINGYSNSVSIYKYPTYNCQLSSLADAKNLLYCRHSDINKLMIYINSYTNPLLLVDINAKFKKDFEELISNYLTINHFYPYISTNKSNMILYMLEWNSIQEKEIDI